MDARIKSAHDSFFYLFLLCVSVSLWFPFFPHPPWANSQYSSRARA
jgi:hypothetical protein